MFKRGVIILSIFLLVFSFYVSYVDGATLCGDRGGHCYWGHELDNYRCPNERPRMIEGQEAERLCEGEGLIGAGAAIWDFTDITGWALEGNVCCLPPLPDMCGNGQLDDREDCDVVNGNINMRDGIDSCDDLGDYEFGSVSCNTDRCEFASNCHNCGNGDVDHGEVCDGENLDGKNCEDVGDQYNDDDETLNCDDCRWDTNECIYKKNPGTVFTTSATFDGDLGGLYGADLKCQRAASDAELDGTWIALLNYVVDMEGAGDNNLFSRSAASRVPWYWNGHVRNMEGEIVSYSLVNGNRISSYDLFPNAQENLNLNENGEGGEVGKFVWVGWSNSPECHHGYYNPISGEVEEEADWSSPLECSSNVEFPAYWEDDMNVDIILMNEESSSWSNIEQWEGNNGHNCLGFSGDEYNLIDYVHTGCTSEASLYCIKLPREIRIDLEGGEEDICEKSTETFTVSIRNTGADLENVVIEDVFSLNGGNVDWNRRSYDSLERGEEITFSHDVPFRLNGRYMREVKVYSNDEVIDEIYSEPVCVDDVCTMGSLIEAVGIDVIDEGVDGCCTVLGDNANDNDGRVCCDGENNELLREDGVCDCLDEFNWDPISVECNYQQYRCGWDEIDEENMCTNLIYILAHPVECLFDQPEGLPYEQACCFDVNYEGEDYYEFMNIEIY